MRLTRTWALAGVGAVSLLSFLAACGDANEPFVIQGSTTDTDSGADAAVDATADATVADSSTDSGNDAADATTDALVDATLTDAGSDTGMDAGSDTGVDTGVDTGLVDAGRDAGGSVVMIGDAAVVIPPLDPSLLGASDAGIVLSDGGLANADGGALTPRQFRDLVNGITCQRVSECCCPGCNAAEQAQTVSQTKCTTGLGIPGIGFILAGNEFISDGVRVSDTSKMAQCLSFLNETIATCQSLNATRLQQLRSVCLSAFTGSTPLGGSCAGAPDCPFGTRCVTGDAGKTCQPLANIGESCGSIYDCSSRGISGSPPAYCGPSEAGVVCQDYLPVGAACLFDTACGAGVCIPDSFGVKRCSDSLPFASSTDPSSYCAKYQP